MKLMTISAFVSLAGPAMGSAVIHDDGSSVPASSVASNQFQPSASGMSDRGGAVLYSASIESGFRYNAGSIGIGGLDNRRVAYDDVPISNAVLAGNTAINVCRVTVAIRRIGGAPATDVDVFWSTFSSTAVSPDTELDLPSNLVGTQALGTAPPTNTTRLVTFGASGGPTLFTVPLNSTLFSGFGAFAIGVRFSNASDLNGWRLATGAPNANVMWQHDPGMTAQPNPESARTFSQETPPNPFAQGYIIIEGTPVPTPGATALLGLAGLAAVRRRRA